MGKTTSVDLFGTEFRQYVALNLDHPGDREIFDQGLPLARTLEAIFFLKNAAKTPTGRRFRLLNLPYFLVHRLDAYLDWAERGGVGGG